MPPLTTASALGARYLPHVADICDSIAHIAARHRLISPLLVLVWIRLRRTLLRLDRLATRWRRGRLATRPRGPRPRRDPPAIHPADAWRPRRTPSRQAWLMRLHQPLAQFAPRIELLLNDPEIAALCQAAPQASRLLRPLARMFGLTHPRIAPAPPPAKPRAPRPKKPRPPPFAEHSPSQWPFVPLRLRLRVPGLRRRKPPD